MPARKPDSDKAKIQEAIAALQASGQADLAAAVQDYAQRAPGWDARPAKDPVVSFRVDKALLDRVVAKAGRGQVSEVAVDGCRRFLAGKLEPVRNTRGPAEGKTRTSVRIPEDLLTKVEETCGEMTDAAGWTVRPVNVIIAAFLDFAPAPRPRKK